jgi:alkylation response protein AidB-like acyl-CoA dehydrogenase
MDFNLPEEIQILKDTVRRFVDKELIPLEHEYRHDSEAAMPEHLLRPLQEKTKAMGLWMLDVPAEYGGAGLGLLPRDSRRSRPCGLSPLSRPRALRTRSPARAVSLQRRTKRKIS